MESLQRNCCRAASRLAHEQVVREDWPTLHPSCHVTVRPEPGLFSSAVPSTRLKHRSTTVIHGQSRSVPTPSEL
jgi:hypothetical protein